MKLILLLALSCLALHNGKGAPTTGRYMFVKCNPKDDKANCVPYQTPKIELTPDLPSQLPASSAKHLEVAPVQDEHPDREGGGLEVTQAKPQLVNDEGESPYPLYEYGSGVEGSADEDVYFADRASVSTGSDTGSGESNMDLFKGKDTSSWPVADEAKPAEEDLKEDHLLQM